MGEAIIGKTVFQVVVGDIIVFESVHYDKAYSEFRKVALDTTEPVYLTHEVK